jgi:3'(2'),5'-bisphosphate nucleotidase
VPESAPHDAERLLPAIVKLAEQAAAVILDHYRGDAAVQIKADASPVTAADEAAEAVILAGLAELTPSIPVIAEEAVASGHIPKLDGGPFWLVDPLDGTKEFISKNGEFTVNIALVEGSEAVLGVVLAPALGKVWWGARGRGAMMRDDGPPDSGAPKGEAKPIKVRPWPKPPVAVASRSHADPQTEAYLDAAGVVERISAGSSLKFCLVAEGKADLYPRFGRTMEWDTAAGNAVLSAAGGRVTTRDDTPFAYRKPGFENPTGFIARGD